MAAVAASATTDTVVTEHGVDSKTPKSQSTKSSTSEVISTTTPQIWFVSYMYVEAIGTIHSIGYGRTHEQVRSDNKTTLRANQILTIEKLVHERVKLNKPNLVSLTILRCRRFHMERSIEERKTSDKATSCWRLTYAHLKNVGMSTLNSIHANISTPLSHLVLADIDTLETYIFKQLNNKENPTVAIHIIDWQRLLSDAVPTTPPTASAAAAPPAAAAPLSTPSSSLSDHKTTTPKS